MIGIFIGSFNPPTLAHLSICLKLKDKFAKVVFVPVNTQEKHLVPLKDRINMLRVYTKKYPFLKIDEIMKNYSFLNYRIIELLEKKYQCITLIMGSDLLLKMDSFDNYEWLLKKYSFIIIPRDGDDVLKIIQDKYQSYQDKFSILDYSSQISSSLARKLIKEKASCENVLDLEIYNYVRKNNFYV